MAGEGSGKKFGTFELRELLGRGESGAVCHAFDHAVDRVVAIKILPAEFLEKPDFLAHFERDASRIKRLDHPAILPLLDCGLLENRPYLVTPLMTGGSLADKLAGGPLSFSDTVNRISTPTRTPTRPSARAYNERGYQQYKARNYDLAIDYFTRAIELKPDYQDAYYYRGRAYGGLTDYKRAISDYSKAIELEPGDSRVCNSRGIVFGDMGAFEQAIADYNQANELDPDHAFAHNNLAWTLAYHLDTEYERALQRAQRSVKLDPDSYNHDTLALVYYKLEQFETALEHYDLALKLDPEQAASCKGRGDVYLAMGNEEAALADYEMYLSLATEGPEREAVEEIVQSLQAREEG